jgi:hypothetical protein
MNRMQRRQESSEVDKKKQNGMMAWSRIRRKRRIIIIIIIIIMPMLRHAMKQPYFISAPSGRGCSLVSTHEGQPRGLHISPTEQ